MKIYFGVNDGTPGPQLIWVSPADGAKPYRLRHYVRHSPDGFQWGYGGSGPSDAARCMLLDCCDAATAERLYGRFKAAFIAPAGRILLIAEDDIHEWVRKENLRDG